MSIDTSRIPDHMKLPEPPKPGAGIKNMWSFVPDFIQRRFNPKITNETTGKVSEFAQNLLNCLSKEGVDTRSVKIAENGQEFSIFDKVDNNQATRIADALTKAGLKFRQGTYVEGREQVFLNVFTVTR